MEPLYEKCAAKFNEKEMNLLQQAYDFAKQVHANQKRESGEPYIMHPVAVATMLFDMGMDSAAVIAGLLHDVIEDGEGVTVETLASMFGKEIANMVDGVTKLTQSGEKDFITKKEQQAENLRKMFLAIANDVRVVIIKLTDRLHNMRTLEYCTHEKRTRKAKETLQVYAPLAHRFGMGAIKSELEDLAFEHLWPEEFKRIKNLVEPQQEERMRLLSHAMETIQHQLKEAGIEAEIGGRAKHLYSTQRKMIRQNSGLNEIYDLIAIRVIVNTISDCYAALGVIHSLWRPVPGRFKDYIAMPKTNMYRSLHTTLFSDVGLLFEVQIRTYEMHRTAEYGIAAHWMYKEGRTVQDDLDSKLTWLRQALEYNNEADDARDFMDSIRKDFFSDYVFVLTPQGEIIDLPEGSTPLDFAYRIHSNVGNHCQHAKVNGAMVRLDYKLKTNDVVEIITSASQPGPSRDWLNIVKTQHAKSKIRQWFKKANRSENIQKGREMLEENAKRLGQNLSVLLKPEYYTELLKKYNFSSLEDIYAAIGYGGITTGQVLHRMMDKHRKAEKAAAIAEQLQKKELPVKPAHESHTHGVIVRGDAGMVVRFAKCCNPLPGDEIIGYVTRGRGVSVHRKDCPNIEGLMSEEVRIIEVEWTNSEKSAYTASIQVTAAERPGLLMDLSQLMLNMNISLSTVNAKADKNGIANVQLSFPVNNTSQLNTVIKNIKKIKAVTDVYRLSV